MNVPRKDRVCAVNVYNCCFSRCVDEKMDVDSSATGEKTSEAKTEVKTESSEEKPSTTDNKVCKKSVDMLLVEHIEDSFLRYDSQQ